MSILYKIIIHAHFISEYVCVSCLAAGVFRLYFNVFGTAVLEC
jgi:hypothetical protein